MEVFEIIFCFVFNPKAHFYSIQKFLNLDAITNENNKDHNKRSPYRMLTIGPSGSGKTNTLLNFIQKQDNDNCIDKIYLYAKELSKPNYQFLIKKHENSGIKNLNDPKFI